MHKSGSTWINSYIHKKFRKIGLTAPPRNLYTEFFPGRKKENMDHIFHQRTDQERIELLERLRTFGLELNQKAHISEIKYIWPWFKKFFKDYDILICKRKHIFTHWLTILFFACVRKATNNIGEIDNTAITPSKQSRPRDEDVLKSTIQEYNVQFKFDQGEFDNFVSNIRFLNDVIIRELDKPQVMWLEDITTDKAAISFQRDTERTFANKVKASYNFDSVFGYYLGDYEQTVTSSVAAVSSVVERPMSFNWLYEKDDVVARVQRELVQYSVEPTEVTATVSHKLLQRDLADVFLLDYNIFDNRAFQIRRLDSNKQENMDINKFLKTFSALNKASSN